MGGGFRQDQWVGVDAEDLSQQNSMWNGLTLNLNLIIVVCLFFLSFDQLRSVCCFTLWCSPIVSCVHCSSIFVFLFFIVFFRWQSN